MATKKKKAAPKKPKSRKPYDWARALDELGWEAITVQGVAKWRSPSGQVSAWSSGDYVLSTVKNVDPKLAGIWSHPPDRGLTYHLQQLEDHFTTERSHRVFVDIGIKGPATAAMRNQIMLTVDCIGAEQARSMVESALQDLIDGRYATKDHVDEKTHNLRYEMEHSDDR